MNGAKKWHKATGPAFATGERWVGAGNISVTIVSVRAYIDDPKHASDWGVTYAWKERGEVVQHEKDAWNFQVRYQHEADLDLKVTKPRSS